MGYTARFEGVANPRVIYVPDSASFVYCVHNYIISILTIVYIQLAHGRI